MKAREPVPLLAAWCRGELAKAMTERFAPVVSMRENWLADQISYPGPKPGRNPVSVEHTKGLGWHLTCLKIKLIIVYVFACVSWVCV